MRIRFKKGKNPDEELDPIAELGLEEGQTLFGEQSDEKVEPDEFQPLDSSESETDLEVSTLDGSGPFYPGPESTDLNLAQSGIDDSGSNEDIEPTEFQAVDSGASETDLEIPTYGESEPLYTGPESPDLDLAQSGIDEPRHKPESSTALSKFNFASALKTIPAFKVPLPKLPSNQVVVTLATEKDFYRVVVFKGSKVMAWGSSPIQQDEIPTEQPEAPDEADGVSSAEQIAESSLQHLLGDLSIRKTNTVWKALGKVGIRRGRTVMDLSLYTTLMRHLQIPRVRGRYLEPVVVAEVLDSLPFSQEEVDISWQTQKDSENHSVFAVALPKNRLDAQVNAAKEAGLIPSAAYSKAASLALASGVPNGIVVHLETDDTALVLVENGEPKTVHQLELGQTESTTEARTTTITRAIEQVAAYFQPDSSGQTSRSLSVILTGKCHDSNPVAKLLRTQLKREILSIEPSLGYSEDFPVEEYAINVGLYLSDKVGNIHAPASQSAKSSTLNLLPDRHRPQPMPVFQTAIFVILMLLVVHPYNVVGRVDDKILENVTIAQELKDLRLEEKDFDLLDTSYQQNQTEIEEISAKIVDLESQIDTLNGDLGARLAQLRAITGPAIPAGVKLAAVVPEGEDFNLAGTARSHLETLQYVLNLRDTGLFEDAKVLSVNGQGGADPNASGNVSFQIKVSQLIESEASESDITEGEALVE